MCAICYKSISRLAQLPGPSLTVRDKRGDRPRYNRHPRSLSLDIMAKLRAENLAYHAKTSAATPATEYPELVSQEGAAPKQARSRTKTLEAAAQREKKRSHNRSGAANGVPGAPTPKRLCKWCKLPMPAIGSWRKNGAQHVDWSERKYHKKCFKLQHRELNDGLYSNLINPPPPPRGILNATRVSP